MFETMKKNRNFWTAERDEELKRFEAGGLSASQIAAVLGTTRGAVLGRSNRLRGKLFRSDLENRQRERSRAAERRAKKQAQSPWHAGADLEVEKWEMAALVDALRADLAVGIGRDGAIQRALRAGHSPARIGAFFDLSIGQVHQIGGVRHGPRRWTQERVELLRSMWPDHAANEIAAVLGTTADAVYRRGLRLGLSRRPAKSKPGEPEHFLSSSAAAPG